MKITSFFFRLQLPLIICLYISSCSTKVDMDDIPETVISQEMLNKVNKRNIYFAHQSVGFNILDGLSKLNKDMNVIEVKDIQPSDQSFFSHSEIGENTKPVLKLQDFSSTLNKIPMGKIDIAFLKFCYVDIGRNTDIESLFDTYKETYESLAKKFPDITFVHFTVPLTIRKTGLKPTAKRILGRDVWGDNQNIKRQEFNILIRNNYDIVFDIAEIESTDLKGIQTIHTSKGYKYFGLVPEYTDDGSHLNSVGSKIVAGKLIKFISEIE